MKNILLLGGSGFIGREILNTLLERGHNVIAIEHKSKIQAESPRLTIVHASAGGLHMKNMPYPPDVIIHAARNRTGKFGKLGRLFMSHKGKKENQALLNYVKEQAGKVKLIYISGSLMYGSHPGKLIDETFPTAPVSFAREYVHAEMPFVKAVEDGNNYVSMVRVPWVIGNGSWFKWAYADYARKHKAIPLYGEGNNKMTFVDVNYVARSIGTLVEKDFYGLLNLYHPQYLTQADWANLLSTETLLPINSIGYSKKDSDAFTEAFHTDISLSSRHNEIQHTLQQEIEPIAHILRKYLPLMF